MKNDSNAWHSPSYYHTDSLSGSCMLVGSILCGITAKDMQTLEAASQGHVPSFAFTFQVESASIQFVNSSL